MRYLLLTLTVTILVMVLSVFLKEDTFATKYLQNVFDKANLIKIINTSKIKTDKAIPKNIVILGDSEACYIKRLTDKNPKYSNLDVYCKGGTTIENYEGYGHLKTALSKHKRPIDLIIILLSANDYWKVKLQNTKPIEEMVKDIPRCIWVGAPKIQGYHWKHTAMLKEYITTQSKCEYFDSEELDIPLIDAWHPTPKGTQMWLDAIWEKF